jgi:hypothetical protein
VLVFILYTDVIGPVIKSSFNTLLRLHEVMQISELVAISADAWTETHAVEEQAGFRYGTAASAVLTGRRRRDFGVKTGTSNGRSCSSGCSESL